MFATREVAISQTTYLTPDSFDAVKLFYKNTLPAKGWSLDTAGYYLTFGWTDSTGLVPWRLRFDVDHRDTTAGTEVTVVLRGVPDVTTVPLYPGAWQVKVETQAGADTEAGGINCITQYRVVDPPGDVRAFYQQNLARFGWVADSAGLKSPFHLGTPAPDTAPDVHFTAYIHPNCTICTGTASVIIHTDPVPGGQTQVTMYTDGVNDQLLCSCSDTYPPVPEGP